MARGGSEEHEWAWRDMRWVAAFVLLLLLFAIHPVFGWGLVGLAAAFAVRVGVGLARKRRRERAYDEPFWADEIGK